MKTVFVEKESYYNSALLMLTSQEVKKTSGVHDATVAMGTAMNLDLLRSLGFDAAALAEATPNDLVIAIDCEFGRKRQSRARRRQAGAEPQSEGGDWRSGERRADQPRFRAPGPARRKPRGHLAARRLRGARSPQGAG